MYHNPNIGFATKCGMQRPMKQDNVFRCETHFQKWGRVQGMEPNDFQMTPTLKVALVWESRMFKTLVGK